MDLKYRIHSISSENSEHPASSLLAHNSDQNTDDNRPYPNFWQSEITPKYPQEITIQFYIPVRTKNMQLIFHPYKIPSKVQIFVKSTKKQKYQKLGYIIPNDNTQSNFLEKEMKTMFFQYPCTFIKIILHKNYRNNRNLFDQVAIWDLKVQGECLPASELAGLDYDFLEGLESDEEEEEKSQDVSLSITPAQSASRAMETKQVKASTKGPTLFPQVFKLLQKAKSQAVERQDFQKASQIKRTMSNFQSLQSQIQELQSQKVKALSQEDYDKCHRIKNEILKKKDQATFQIKQIQQYYLENMSEAHSRLIPQPYYPTNIQNSYHTNRTNQQQYDDAPSSPVPNRSRYNNPQTNRITDTANIDQSKYYDKYESQVVPALKKKIEEQFNSVSKVNDSLLDNGDRASYYQGGGTTKRNNTQQSRSILPANNPKDMQEYAEESIDIRNFEIEQIINEYPKLEPMDLKDQKKYQQYFGYIESDLWRLALSQKFWKLKGYALDKIIEYEIVYGFHIQAMLEMVAIIIEDTHPVNVKKCLLLLERLINLQNKDNFQFQQSTNSKYCIEIILANLLHLLTDTKEQFRKLAAEIYKNLPDFGVVSLEQSIKFIVKENYSIHNTSGIINGNKSKRKYTPKQILAKMNLVEYLVMTYQDCEAYSMDIIKWAVKNLQDPDSNVKSAATKLLLQICLRYRQYYPKTKDEILKKKSRREICQNFQTYYEQIIEAFDQQQEKNQQRGQNSESDEDDFYKKETIMNKKKPIEKRRSEENEEDPQIHLQKIQESPIPTPNKLRQSADIELAYSQESLFQENSHQSHEWFASKGQTNEKYGDLHVMEPFDNELEGMCDYCFQKIDEHLTLNEHLLEYCPALIACLFCNNQIYFRELNEHWISECPKKCHQQCPRCLVAFEIDEINEHIARRVCRKVNPQSGIQICPLCYTDVEGDDLAWVQHAQICQGVRQIKNRIKQKSRQNQNQSMKSLQF